MMAIHLCETCHRATQFISTSVAIRGIVEAMTYPLTAQAWKF